MTVDVSDLTALIEDEARRLRDAAADIVLAACKDDAPVSEDNPVRTTPPGGLRDSLQIVDVVDEAPTFGFSIVSDLDYAGFTDEVDTAPHLIFADAAPMLRFWWESGPRGADIYYYTFVRHPGTSGQRWFQSRNEERFEQALAEVT